MAPKIHGHKTPEEAEREGRRDYYVTGPRAGQVVATERRANDSIIGAGAFDAALVAGHCRESDNRLNRAAADPRHDLEIDQ